jgi:hypothetical protein
VLLDGVNHIAWISRDAERLKAFYARVFGADVGPTRAHGDKPGETMTVIRIGPHTELNIVTIEGNTEPQRQTPMWGRGRIDHFGLQAASPDAFHTIRTRLMERGRQRRHHQRLRLGAQCVFPRPRRARGRGTAHQAVIATAAV